MPISSHRGKDISASPIRSLLPYARAAIARGKKMYHLNIGQPDIPTPPAAIKAIKDLDQTIVKYGPSEGLTELREAVAKYYDKFEARVSYSDVFINTGASEAILFALLACFDPGDEVIIPEPFYANYLGFAHISEVNIRPITSFFEEQFVLPSPERFEQMINTKTKAIFLCNPGNPTGQMYNADQLAGIAKLVKKHDLFLIVDEVYREFCYDQEFKSVLSFQEIENHVIVIDSISKVFSACGARIGYLITKNEDVKNSINKYAQLRLCPPYYGQKLALACYQNPDSYIATAKKEYRHRRDVLYSILQKIEGVKCYMPNSAFYNMVELPVDNAELFCKWLLTDFEYKNSTVMLAPGNGFYFNKEIGKSQVRIAYILQEEDLRMSIECLKLGLSAYQKRK